MLKEPDQLMEDDQLMEPCTVSSIPLHNPNIRNEFDHHLSPFGFSVGAEELSLPRGDTDWSIERSKGRPFKHNKQARTPLFNPKYRILFGNKEVAEVRVDVGLCRTDYFITWKYEVLRSLAPAPAEDDNLKEDPGQEGPKPKRLRSLEEPGQLKEDPGQLKEDPGQLKEDPGQLKAPAPSGTTPASLGAPQGP